jgi:hypothetical protein
MTTAELLAELILLLGNRSTEAIPISRYYTWLTNSQNELAYGLRLPEVEKKVTAIMVVGTAVYGLPSDLVAIYNLRDNTLKRRIRKSGFRKFDNIWSETSGDPTHYIRFGSNIQLTPVPSNANTLQIRYAKVISSINAILEPAIGVMWNEAILLGAEYRGWKSLGEYQRMSIVKNEYISIVRSRRAEVEQEDEDEDFGMEVVR